MGTFPPSLHKLLLSTNIPRIAEKREFSGQATTFLLLLSLSLADARGCVIVVGVILRMRSFLYECFSGFIFLYYSCNGLCSPTEILYVL